MKRKNGARKQKIRYMAGILLLAMLAGCGQDNGAGEEEINLSEQEDQGKQTEENSLERWKSSLREGNPQELMAEAFRGVSVMKDGEVCFAVSYEPRAYKNSFDCWAVSVPYQSMVTVDTEEMYTYFHILEDMELVPADGITREEAGTGEYTDTVFVAYYSGQTQESGQAEPDRGITFCFGDQDENDDYYVEAGGKLWIAQKAAVEELFAVNPYMYILKVVNVVHLETVSKILIAFDGDSYEMRSNAGKYWWNDKEAESSEFYELYTELMSVFIERELSPEDKKNINTRERELLMSVTFERNREDAPKIVQRYYVYDEMYASVQVNGTEFFLVSREALAQVQKKIREVF